MLKIPIDPIAVQGEQLRTELKAKGLTTEIRLIGDGSDERPWEFHLIDLGPSDEPVVRAAIAAHQPDRQYGWSAEAKAAAATRAADDAKIREVLAKPNPTPLENRDVIAILAKRQGII